jgi:4-amino-4-deoxy-L-arabinose transferase-like glycosyltransferase
MVNPLAHHYYLAGLMKVGGEKTWWLRLGCVVLSAFSALFIFGFARRFTDNPFLATLLVLVTPVFWLTSYSLLIDSTLAFFFFGGLYFFLRLTETDRWDFAISSGVFMGLAILSKYPGIFVLPLSAVWFIFRWGKMVKRSRAVVPWLIALLFLAGYSWYTKHVYGQAHILAASARMVNSYGWPKILSLFVFLSGSFVLPLISWLVVGRLTRLVALLIFSLCVFFFSSAFGGFSKTQAVLLGLWLVTSVLMFSVYAGLFRKWVYPRDHFVFAWVVGFMAMMIVVMGWVAVRYYAIVAPALVFLIVRLIEMKWRASAPKILGSAIAILIFFSGLLAYADYKQAEPSRLIGKDLLAAGFQGGERHYYLGDSFTMSYLKEQGWTPCFPDSDIQPGDLVLAKEVTMPLIWFKRKPIAVEEVRVFNYPTRFPIKVMDYYGSAGFYASVWGALPFTFSAGPWERFHLFKVVSVKTHEPS